MTKYIVTYTFEFEIEASNEDEAEKIADGGFHSYIDNPQTKKWVRPDVEVEEVV